MHYRNNVLNNRHSFRMTTSFVLFLSTAWGVNVNADEVTFPVDAAVLDVQRDLGAKSDGVAGDIGGEVREVDNKKARGWAKWALLRSDYHSPTDGRAK